MDFSTGETPGTLGGENHLLFEPQPGERPIRTLVIIAAAFLAAGCTTVRSTSAARSSQELLLISTAADRAAEALAAQVPSNITAYLDLSGFAAQDAAYGGAAIQDALLRHGVRLVSDRTKADAVILPRAGDLSTDERQTLFGIPALPTPITVSTGTVLPALSLYQETEAKGIAKFAATVYDPKTGKLIVSTDPAYGFSHENDGVVLFFITWRKNDMGLDPTKNPPRVADRK
jgi:hypothetical protein